MTVVAQRCSYTSELTSATLVIYTDVNETPSSLESSAKNAEGGSLCTVIPAIKTSLSCDILSTTHDDYSVSATYRVVPTHVTRVVCTFSTVITSPSRITVTATSLTPIVCALNSVRFVVTLSFTARITSWFRSSSTATCRAFKTGMVQFIVT